MKKSIKTKDEYGYEWEGYYSLDDNGELPEGGLILQDLRHAGYNFAKEVRILGFWVEFEIIKPSSFSSDSNTLKRYYPLSRQYFNYTKPIILSQSKKEINDNIKRIKKKWGKLYSKEGLKEVKKKYGSYLNLINELGTFSKFDFVKGLRAIYTFSDTFGMENSEYSNFDVIQTFLFTDYDKYPAHEPSGNLSASRFFPLIKLEFNKNPNYDPNAEIITKVKTVRVDYKLHLKTDAFIYTMDKEKKRVNPENIKEIVSTSVDSSDISYIIKNKPQQAGFFIDEENPDVWGGASKLFSTKQGSTVTQAVFKAAEKPLVYEISTYGLARGLPGFSENDVAYKTWDNVHWWGGYKDFHLPSAPGAFHAIHLHWRWGGSVKGNFIHKPAFGSEKQFISSGVPKELLTDPRYEHMIGPLVDPKCWIQTIRVAVVKSNKDDDDSTFDFNDKFKDIEASPGLIEDGANLALFYSITLFNRLTLKEAVITVFKDTQPPGPVKLPEKTFYSGFSGTLFIHGIFFAHEEENAGDETGTTTEEYFPDSKEEIKKSRDFYRIIPY